MGSSLASSDCKRPSIKTWTGGHVSREKHKTGVQQPHGDTVGGGDRPQQMNTLRNATNDRDFDAVSDVGSWIRRPQASCLVGSGIILT